MIRMIITGGEVEVCLKEMTELDASFEHRKNMLKLIKYIDIRPPDRSVLLKNNFLISEPKYMLWVLKRTISMRWFF